MSDLRQLIDAWQQLDDARLAANKAAAEATSQAEKAKQALLSELGENNLTGAGGSEVLVEVVPRTVPTVSDWSKVYEFVKEFEAFDLLQKRVGSKAVSLRWADGIEIPGIEATEIPNLRRMKLK